MAAKPSKRVQSTGPPSPAMKGKKPEEETKASTKGQKQMSISAFFGGSLGRETQHVGAAALKADSKMTKSARSNEDGAGGPVEGDGVTCVHDEPAGKGVERVKEDVPLAENNMKVQRVGGIGGQSEVKPGVPGSRKVMTGKGAPGEDTHAKRNRADVDVDATDDPGSRKIVRRRKEGGSGEVKAVANMDSVPLEKQKRRRRLVKAVGEEKTLGEDSPMQNTGSDVAAMEDEMMDELGSKEKQAVLPIAGEAAEDEASAGATLAPSGNVCQNSSAAQGTAGHDGSGKVVEPAKEGGPGPKEQPAEETSHPVGVGRKDVRSFFTRKPTKAKEADERPKGVVAATAAADSAEVHEGTAAAGVATAGVAEKQAGQLQAKGEMKAKAAELIKERGSPEVEGSVRSGGGREADGEEVESASEGELEGQSAPEGIKARKGKTRVSKGKAQPKVKKEPGIGDGLYALASKHGDYDPIKAATWEQGEPVPFLFLAKAFDAINAESGRLAMTEILCNVFRTIITTTPQDILPAVYLAANKLAPPHEGVELGVGDSLLIKALVQATGRSDAVVKAELKKKGDLGLVAQASRSTQRTMIKPQPLTCAHVLETLRQIAKESGTKSTDKKVGRIRGMLVAAQDCEPQYITRLVQGKLRIGMAENTVMAALAMAVVLSEDPPPSTKELPGRLEEAGRIMKKVYSEVPSYDLLVPAILEVGIRRLPDVCHFTIGLPVKPMLAKPTKGISEILEKVADTEFTCEYKYDGERAQIHGMEDGSVFIYSRNAEDVTERYPDIVASMKNYVKPDVKSYVLDAEAVAYDRAKGKILPFQILSTRGRKDVQAADIKVQLCLYAFDLLYLNGQAMLEEQLVKRREALHESFTVVTGEFQIAEAITSSDVEEIQTFLQKAVEDSCEGLIIKTLGTDATYEPSQRSNNWLKLKKDYMDTIGDTVDLVPIGAFHGRGKRAGVYGAFLLAVYDSDKEEFQSVCNVGTGFSETMLVQRSAALKAHVIDKPRAYYRVGDRLANDVDEWFDTVEVWEVKAADLSVSPVHQAAVGLVDSSKGIGLRFPRFLRLREDKKPDDATSAEQIAEMYRAQKINHTDQGAGAEAD